MMCPLIVTRGKDRLLSGEDRVGDCLGERCAWWECADGLCAMIIIMRLLDGIKSGLFDLVREKGGVG